MTRTDEALGLLAAAREMDQQVRGVARRRNRDKILLARLLLEMHEAKMADALGFESVAAYAEVAIGQGRTTTRQLIGLARRLRDEPALAEVGENGELPWTVLRTVASVASGENVGGWLEKARELPRAELERQAREARGEEGLERVVLEVGREDLEDMRLAVESVWRERPELSFGAALAEVCRAVRRVGCDGGATTGTRLVLHTCGSCETTTRETRDGALAVPEQAAARAACDAEVLDVREGPAAVRRAIPPKVANFVDARDRGRCRVPGCRNRVFLERHHEGEGGWRAVGHSPEHVLTLCVAHHVARHEGRLSIEGDANARLTFRLADGSEIVDDRRGVPRGTSPSDLAEAALRKLAFTAAEARKCLAVAVAEVGSDATVEALTRAALRASG